MPYDNIVSRADAGAFIPEDVVAETIRLPRGIGRARALPARLDGIKHRVHAGAFRGRAGVLGGRRHRPQADHGMAWQGVTLTAEEIAAIVPVPEAVAEDSSIDLWAEIQDGLTEAVGVTLDQAVFSGINKPASWPTTIVPGAVAAGNVATAGTATVEEGGIVGDIDTALDAVEADGFDPSGIAAKRSLRGMLRRVRDLGGQRLADAGGATVEGPAGPIRRRRRVRRRHARRHRGFLDGRRGDPFGYDLQTPRPSRDHRRHGRRDLQLRAAGHVGLARGVPCRRRGREPDHAPR